MSEDLQPISPDEAKRMYLEEKSSEASQSTVQAHDYRLRHFVRWCDEEDIENLNTLTGRDLHKYKLWRRDDGDLNNVSLVTQLSTLRVFIRWCEQIEAVKAGLNESIVLPELSKGEDQRDAMLSSEEAGELLDYLREFEFATRTHALVEVLWHSGMRIGAAQSLDVGDYKSDEALLELRHRPDQGTKLKNGEEGERYIAINNEVCDVLDAYIEYHREDVTDDYGRRPLFSSRAGRPQKSTLRDSLYKITRPCIYTNHCPHDRDTDDCEALERNKASKCPSSVSPHAIRRGSITHHLSDDIPDRVVSDRMDVSLDVLEKHYDRRTEREKSEQRRDYIPD
ncbi:tyrosine-type recombinase/integrase [Halomicroarcula sp. F28]|uniref:tyrosine-type recombinase/integrase n=1 Tax=Haloarcula salinisoli TaxID=2487746 RepID=UPI001C731E77|nr:tyrosine-type recombinase/integrase [Halomicroarcula salinisoli]MBX0287541.1 tyrosine-type recombinase/integrase [Halomicroarcula salinisoli]